MNGVCLSSYNVQFGVSSEFVACLLFMFTYLYFPPHLRHLPLISTFIYVSLQFCTYFNTALVFPSFEGLPNCNRGNIRTVVWRERVRCTASHAKNSASQNYSDMVPVKNSRIRLLSNTRNALESRMRKYLFSSKKKPMKSIISAQEKKKM